MIPTGILETALYVDDLDKAVEFYGGVLGLQLLGRLENRHAFVRCGDGVLLLFNPAETEKPFAVDARLPVPPHGARGPGHMCFRGTAEDLVKMKAHLEAKGVEVEAELEWPNGGRSIYFRDPAGNSLEMAEPRIWGF